MNSIEHSDESGTWVLAATGFTTPIEDDSPKVIKTCVCPELGYWCAEYITNEMKKNPKSPEGKKLKGFLDSADPYTAYDNLPWWQKIISFKNISSLVTNNAMQSEENALRYWKSLVGYKCIWDHKPFLKEKLSSFLEEKGFVVNKDSWPWSKLGNYDYYFDIWSNIHYGFVGIHVGFMEETLTAGASFAQYMQDRNRAEGTQYHPENGALYNRFDDISDQISIRIGTELAKSKKPDELSVFDLIKKIESIPTPWGDKDSAAKRIHKCYCRS